MFTRTIDDALTRYTLEDGTQVAFAHDECRDNPVEDYGYKIGIQRDERNAMSSDPVGVLAEYDSLHIRIGDLEAWCEWYRGVSDGEEPIDAMEELEECREEIKGITYLEWKDTDEYGWPTYRIAYRAEDLIADGWNADKLDEIVKDMAREYSAWACGSIYLMGVETPDGDQEYVVCDPGFDPYDEEEVKDMVSEIVGNADGLARA